MKSILEDCYTLFLEKLVYDGKLQILVCAGIVADKIETMMIGDVEMEGCRRILKADQFYLIEFPSVIFWQLIDESYSSFDSGEKRDDNGKFINTISSSKYQDYLNETHGWYKYSFAETKMYRIWTEDDVVEVVSSEPPIVSKICKNSTNNALTPSRL